MQRILLPVFAALLSVADHSVAQPPVESKGIASKIRLEEVVSGHLAELNGKFKLRVTEVTFAPGGQLGPHHHVGPGIRYVISGKVTFVQGGATTVYAAGDYFYESGNIAHTAYNGTKVKMVDVIEKNLKTGDMVEYEVIEGRPVKVAKKK